MTKRIALYARVSTDKQTVDNQLIELRSLCERLGYTIVQEYTDNGISGAKGRKEGGPGMSDTYYWISIDDLASFRDELKKILLSAQKR